MLTFPATSTTLGTLRAVGWRKNNSKGVWMHVVISSSRVVCHHRIISFLTVCYGFVVVAGVWSLYVLLTGPLFVVYSMHFIPLVVVCHLACLSASL